MKTINYDIKILDTEEDIINTLSSINNRGLNILYSRTLVSLKLGYYSYTLPYDTVFTSNRNELLLLLNEQHSNLLKKELSKNEIDYHEIAFQEETYEYKKPQNNKEIVFVRGLQSLKKALKDSKSKNHRECTYNPYTKGKIRLRYYLRDDSKENLFETETKGLIELEDKVIFLLNQDEKRNVNYKQVLKMLSDLHMIATISDEYDYNVLKPKKYTKK